MSANPYPFNPYPVITISKLKKFICASLNDLSDSARKWKCFVMKNSSNELYSEKLVQIISEIKLGCDRIVYSTDNDPTADIIFLSNSFEGVTCWSLGVRPLPLGEVCILSSENSTPKNSKVFRILNHAEDFRIDNWLMRFKLIPKSLLLPKSVDLTLPSTSGYGQVTAGTLLPSETDRLEYKFPLHLRSKISKLQSYLESFSDCVLGSLNGCATLHLGVLDCGNVAIGIPIDGISDILNTVKKYKFVPNISTFISLEVDEVRECSDTEWSNPMYSYLTNEQAHSAIEVLLGRLAYSCNKDGSEVINGLVAVDGDFLAFALEAAKIINGTSTANDKSLSDIIKLFANKLSTKQQAMIEIMLSQHSKGHDMTWISQNWSPDNLDPFVEFVPRAIIKIKVELPNILINTVLHKPNSLFEALTNDCKDRAVQMTLLEIWLRSSRPPDLSSEMLSNSFTRILICSPTDKDPILSTVQRNVDPDSEFDFTEFIHEDYDAKLNKCLFDYASHRFNEPIVLVVSWSLIKFAIAFKNNCCKDVSVIIIVLVVWSETLEYVDFDNNSSYIDKLLLAYVDNPADVIVYSSHESIPVPVEPEAVDTDTLKSNLMDWILRSTLLPSWALIYQNIVIKTTTINACFEKIKSLLPVTGLHVVNVVKKYPGSGATALLWKVASMCKPLVKDCQIAVSINTQTIQALKAKCIRGKQLIIFVDDDVSTQSVNNLLKEQFSGTLIVVRIVPIAPKDCDVIEISPILSVKEATKVIDTLLQSVSGWSADVDEALKNHKRSILSKKDNYDNHIYSIMFTVAKGAFTPTKLFLDTRYGSLSNDNKNFIVFLAFLNYFCPKVKNVPISAFPITFSDQSIDELIRFAKGSETVCVYFLHPFFVEILFDSFNGDIWFDKMKTAWSMTIDALNVVKISNIERSKYYRAILVDRVENCRLSSFIEHMVEEGELHFDDRLCDIETFVKEAAVQFIESPHSFILMSRFLRYARSPSRIQCVTYAKDALKDDKTFLSYNNLIMALGYAATHYPSYKKELQDTYREVIKVLPYNDQLRLRNQYNNTAKYLNLPVDNGNVTDDNDYEGTNRGNLRFFRNPSK